MLCWKGVRESIVRGGCNQYEDGGGGMETREYREDIVELWLLYTDYEEESREV